jgi:hypothetical protein
MMWNYVKVSFQLDRAAPSFPAISDAQLFDIVVHSCGNTACLSSGVSSGGKPYIQGESGRYTWSSRRTTKKHRCKDVAKLERSISLGRFLRLLGTEFRRRTKCSKMIERSMGGPSILYLVHFDRERVSALAEESIKVRAPGGIKELTGLLQTHERMMAFHPAGPVILALLLA